MWTNCEIEGCGALRRSGVLRRGAGGPVTLGVGTIPLGVSCQDGTALVSVTTEGPDAPSRVLRVRGDTVEQLPVGPNPRAVRLLDGGPAAVDVEKGNGRAIRIVDLASGTGASRGAGPRFVTGLLDRRDPLGRGGGRRWRVRDRARPAFRSREDPRVAG
jgi:hypothetical protein